MVYMLEAWRSQFGRCIVQYGSVALPRSGRDEIRQHQGFKTKYNGIIWHYLSLVFWSIEKNAEVLMILIHLNPSSLPAESQKSCPPRSPGRQLRTRRPRLRPGLPGLRPPGDGPCVVARHCGSNAACRTGPGGCHLPWGSGPWGGPRIQLSGARASMTMWGVP